MAIFVEALTDNRNRTVAEVRNVLTRNGGSLGENGSVAWIFEPRGIVVVNLDTNDADEVTLQAIDAGATDVNLADKTLEIYTNLENLEDVRRTMEDAGLEVETAERTFVPKTMVTLDDQKSTQVVRLIERLEDLDDVQNVSANLDLSEELVAQPPERTRLGQPRPDQSRLDELTARARRVIAGGACGCGYRRRPGGPGPGGPGHA